MALYLFILKVLTAARITEHFSIHGDAEYHAGLLAFLQTALLVILGQGLVSILFSGVFLFTLWLGFFRLLELIENKPSGWTCFVIVFILPLLAHF